MRRLSALTLSFLCAVIAQAQCLRADSLELYEVGKPVDELIYRVGVRRPKGSDFRLTVLWNYVDSTRLRRAEFDIPATAHDDALTSPRLLWRIVERRDGVDSLVAKGDDALRDPAGTFTFSLTATSAGARLRAGSTTLAVDIPVAFDRDSTASLGLLASRDVSMSEHTLRTVDAPALPPYPAPTADIERRIAESADPAEGIWVYLDRDTDPEKANPARVYTLATVADGNGAYTIVDISDPAAPVVKGSMVPLPFDGHYTLLWDAADGRRLDTDNGAVISHAGSVLSLSFPLHSATIRFYRRPGKLHPHR